MLKTTISKSDLWSIISSPSNLELFHPFCDKNPVIKWPGTGSVDQIIYYSGLILEREFINWIDNSKYELLIGENGGKKSFVSWKIKENKDYSILSVSIYPHKFNQGNKLVNFLPFQIIVRPTLTRYINSVMNGLEYHIETNLKVKKNQFGNHRIFSVK